MADLNHLFSQTVKSALKSPLTEANKTMKIFLDSQAKSSYQVIVCYLSR